MIDYIGIDSTLFLYYAIDLVIMITILVCLRYVSGFISNVSSQEQLAKKDNSAYGLSLAGAALSITILLTGVVSGEAAINPLMEALIMFAYGGLGLFLMVITRKIFDHLLMPNISIQEEIMKGNVAAGIIDAGNMMATALVLRAVMVWVDSNSFIGLIAVLGGYVISQLIMYIATVYRKKTYKMRHNGEMIHTAFQKGNSALALRFAGHRMGIGLAVTAASGIIVYAEDAILSHLIAWSAAAILMFVALTVFSILARYAILYSIDVVEEVDKQMNKAVGAIEASIYLAVGLLLAGLFG